MEEGRMYRVPSKGFFYSQAESGNQGSINRIRLGADQISQPQ
jgi:hypothetical protein